MLFMPFQILGMWFRGLLSFALIGAGAYMLYEWNNRRETVVTEQAAISPEDAPPAADNSSPLTTIERTRVVHWQFGFNIETALLLGGAALLLWSFGGGWVTYPRLFRRRGNDEPHSLRAGEQRAIRRPDGAELQVEYHGPANAPQIILIHGWGLDSDEWYYAKKELGKQYRLIVWDLAGLGQSGAPTNNDLSLEKLARDLDAVIDASSPRPVVLLGHSIGGMIILTYCRLFPQKIAANVNGLILAQSTYTNPVKTTTMAGLMQALQKPLLEPLCHLTIWLSPLVRLMGFMSYVNGSAHRSTERSSFSGNETRGQLDFLTRYNYASSPAVVARGFLGMFRYDATNVLPAIAVPTLVVAGDQDTMCKPEASAFMAGNIPNARLVTLAQSRHCGLFEHHQEFHKTVSDFMQSLEGHTSTTSSRRVAREEAVERS